MTPSTPGIPVPPRPATLEAACFALSWACQTQQCIATVIHTISSLSAHLARARRANVALVGRVLAEACEMLPTFQKSMDSRDGWDHALVLALDISLKVAVRFGLDEGVKAAIRGQNPYLQGPWVGLAGAMTGASEVAGERVMKVLENQGYVVSEEWGMVADKKLVVGVDVGEKRVQILQRGDVIVRREKPKTGRGVGVGAWVGGVLGRGTEEGALSVAWRGVDDGYTYRRIRMDKKVRAWWEGTVKEVGGG